MAKLNGLTSAQITEVVVRLEADAKTARLLTEAADPAGLRPRVIITYQGDALAEVVSISDPGFPEKQRDLLSQTAAGRAGAAAGPEVVLPDPEWQHKWEALQA